MGKVVEMEKTAFGNLVPSMDYSNVAVNDAMTRACGSEEYVQCAVIRIGQPFSKNELNQEILRILTDQSLENLIMRGSIEYRGGQGREAKFRQDQNRDK